MGVEKTEGINFFKKVLMCEPTHFSVEYKINEWMGGEVDRRKAMNQWIRLKETIESCGVDVEVIPQKDGLPDMVFCCNSGLSFKNQVYLSHFRHPERQGERAEYKKWFMTHGFDDLGTTDFFFEGGGDAVFSSPDKLWAGYGYRSQKEVYAEIEKMGDFKTIYCELVDPRFYHMDVCLMPLGPDLALWYPQAFSAESRERMEKEAELIPVSEEEAKRFVCNGMTIGKRVILPSDCPETKKGLEERGFRVEECDMSEFLKAGGACQCLVMKLC